MLSLYLGNFVMSCILYFHFQYCLIEVSSIGIIFIISRWFLDIWIESLTGRHTKKVAKGLRLGFVLMIASEVMFFLSFF